MNDEARKARNEYMRKWRLQNKDKLKKNVDDYWERKAEKLKESDEKQEHAKPDQE